MVVETVDFQHNEPGNFPPPTTPEEVGARLLAQERFESNPIRVSNFLPPITPEEVGARLLAQGRFESNPIRVSQLAMKKGEEERKDKFTVTEEKQLWVNIMDG